MKVLIVTRYMGLLGGAENLIKEFSIRLRERSVETAVIALNVSEEIRSLCGDLKFITPARQLPYTFRSTGLFRSLGIIREIALLRRLVKRHAGAFDLINAHNFPAEWVAGQAAKPVVWMCNEVPDFYNNPRPSLALRALRAFGIALDRHMVKRSVDEVVVADAYNAGQVSARYGCRPQVIHYGIEYDFFSSQGDLLRLKEDLGLAGRFVLIQAGMISPQKNQMKSIQALEQLRERIPQIKLVLAGRPQEPYDSMLKEYVHAHGLEEQIIFTGHVSKEKVRDLYHCADLAVFPVLTQGGWLAPFEALSSGTPVIVSTTMGAASVIAEHSLGTVSDDLSGSIREVYEQQESYRRKTQAAAAWVKTHLSWDSFTDRMCEVFQKALERRRQR